MSRATPYIEPLLAVSGVKLLNSRIEDDIARTARSADPGTGGALHDAAPTAWAEARVLHPRLHTLLRAGAPDRRRIRRFLLRHPLPLVEPDTVTFLFHGEAEAVRLRHFMRGVPNGVPFDRIPATALWHLRLPVPGATRFEYKLDVLRHGHGTWINDPHNPRLATDPFGANSVGHTFGYAPPDWTRPDPSVPSGRLETFDIVSRAFAETRPLQVYLPAGFREDATFPLLIVHDGADFVEHAGLATALDNLIHRGDLPPVVAALTDPGERNEEYTGDRRHADFLTGEALPSLRARFPTRAGAENTVLMGASLGAVAALATAVRHPGVYGALALMSGSFIFDRGLLEGRDPLFTRIADLLDGLWEAPPPLPARAFVGCGLFEGLIGQNRVMANFLRARGVSVRLMETRDAHHWQNWRDQLRPALGWTLPAAR